MSCAIILARLDSHLLLTVVLAGDQRLIERFRAEDLLPLGSRMRVRWRSSAARRKNCRMPASYSAKGRRRETHDPEVIATVCDHAKETTGADEHAGELLALAAQREAPQIDEKLFFELFATPSRRSLKPGSAAMSGLPSNRPIVSPTAPRSNAGLSPDCVRAGGRHRRRRAKMLQVLLAWTWPSRSLPAPRVCAASGGPAGRVLLYAAEDACMSCAEGSRASVPPQSAI